MTSYEKLQSRKQALKDSFGDRIQRMDRIATLEIDEELLIDIEGCIKSNEELSILEGFYFLRALLINRDFSIFPVDFVQKLIGFTRTFIESNSKVIVYSVLEWYVAFRKNYPDYREKMLALLNSDDVGEREGAIKYYETYALEGEYKPLLEFENDEHACQIGHSGDWEYELRDKALIEIEKQLGINLKKTKLRKPYEGAIVSWYDWSEVPVKRCWRD